jgi:hypothetical protein
MIINITCEEGGWLQISKNSIKQQKKTMDIFIICCAGII